MLRLERVHTHYGAIKALDDVSVEVRRGEIVALIGANGAGKSTLLMTVCASPRASRGRVWFEDEDITALPTCEIMRRGIAVAPEGRRVFSQLTVLENLSMGGFFLNKRQLEQGLDHVQGLAGGLRGPDFSHGWDGDKDTGNGKGNNGNGKGNDGDHDPNGHGWGWWKHHHPHPVSP